MSSNEKVFHLYGFLQLENILLLNNHKHMEVYTQGGKLIRSICGCLTQALTLEVDKYTRFIRFHLFSLMFSQFIFIKCC